MAISFNNIPTTTRTPGVYTEVDNSRALQGLVANPHVALIIGQMNRTNSSAPLGTKENEILYAITRDNLADGYFGTGSELARMCNTFKSNNPNTELYAIGISTVGTTAQASAIINFSDAMSAIGGSIISADQNLNLLLNGIQIQRALTSGWSAIDICSDLKTYISEALIFPCTASAPDAGIASTSNLLYLSAIHSGEAGNYLDVRANYFAGQSFPTYWGSTVPTVSNFEGGAGNPDLDSIWPIIEGSQFQHIVQPYVDATSLTSIENEMDDRWKPLEDLPGHGYTCYKNTQANCTTLGNTRNNPHNTILGIYDAPTAAEEIAAAFCAIAAANLNIDPARPLHYLKLKNVLAPPVTSRFTQNERNTLLFDGIATNIYSSSDEVLIERAITTYQKNAAGVADPSYLDIQTLFTLIEIKFQYKARMTSRFLVPRFKLADDAFPVQPGQKIATPATVRQEIISLFTFLRDTGLIENLQDFIDNLIVERNTTDVNRVDVLLPPDLINQFRVLASVVQFIL